MGGSRNIWRLVAEIPRGALGFLRGSEGPSPDEPADPGELDEGLWGARPDEARLSRAKDANRQLLDRLAHDVAERSLSREQALDRLGIGESALDQMVARRAVLWFEHESSSGFPEWQFDERSGRLLSGVAQLADAFPGDVLALSEWVTTPSLDLGGRPPRAVLQDGEVDAVVSVVDSLDAAAR